jgi:hypothetical protein
LGCRCWPVSERNAGFGASRVRGGIRRDEAGAVKGTVTRMEWINPHAWIHVDVKGQDGAVVNWMVEAGTPNTLFRRGFTKDSLQPGTEIFVDGYQAKDGSNKANGRDITFPDGRKLFNRRPVRREEIDRCGAEFGPRTGCLSPRIPAPRNPVD